MLQLGTYEHSLDSKNRLTLPSKLLTKLPKDLVISFGVDRCIELRTHNEYEQFCESLFQHGSFNKKAREIQRFINANSFEITIDSSNRILIPNVLLELTNIKKDVVVIGVGNKIEIWDKSTYQTNFEKAIPELANLMEALDE